MTDRATGARTPLEAGRMAAVLAAIREWTPQPAIPQEPEAAAGPDPVPGTLPDITPDAATGDQPVTAGDETREIVMRVLPEDWDPARMASAWADLYFKPIVVGRGTRPAELGGSDEDGEGPA